MARLTAASRDSQGRSRNTQDRSLVLTRVLWCGRCRQVGPHFKQASNFLWPFKLSSPSGGYKNKLIHFIEGGDSGQRGTYYMCYLHPVV
jgi:hypothetical protein